MDEVSKLLKIPCFGDQFDADDLEKSVIRSFFRGKVVFLTGATGFLGQLFVEKLLRCEVAHIYILARAKKNKTPEERIAEVFTGAPFCLLKKYDPDYLQRLTIIEGDIAQLKIGIKEADLSMMYERVHLIFHVAADVRFQEKLHTLIMINLRGTRELLRLLENFKKLQMFTYISTAYSNCPKGRNIYEKFYDFPIDPDTMISLAERISNDVTELDSLEAMTELIIKPWPNTYTYTKSLSEELVRRYGKIFPTIVIRPSIVISTHKEPVPAWANNIYGYNGILVASGVGLMRTAPLKKKIVGDIVCADFVINSTLAAMWARHDQLKQKNGVSGKDLQAKIYMVGSSVDNPIEWFDFSSLMLRRFSRTPSAKILWVTCLNATTNPYIWIYYNVLFHFLPSLVIDAGLKLSGSPLRILPGTRKIKIFLNSLIYFMQHEWIFDNSNMRSVIDSMSSTDQKLFSCDLRNFDLDPWIEPYMAGLRLYIVGEKLHARSDEIGRKRFRRKRIMHYFVQAAYYALNTSIIYGVAKGFGLIDCIHDGVRDWQQFLANPENLRIP